MRTIPRNSANGYLANPVLVMTISRGDFQLTPEQRRFRDLIRPYDYLARYWDWESRCLDEASLDHAMAVFSHGQRIMAAFFRAVWTGSDQAPLSILEAVRTLDTDDLAIITGWMRDPFFP